MMGFVATLVLLLLVGPLLLIGVAGALLLSAAVVPPGPRRARETFRCPWTQRVVTVDFLLDEGATRPSEVTSCTAFADPRRITCQRACRELAEVRWAFSRAVFPRWALTAGGPVSWRNPGE